MPTTETRPLHASAKAATAATLATAELAARASATLDAAVVDSLTYQVAVIDGSGFIISVNRAWREFATSEGAPELVDKSVGLNYLDICASAAGSGRDPEGELAEAGIRAVLSGEQSDFYLEYPCHSPQAQRWFKMHVSRLHGEHAGAVLSHEDITLRVQAEMARAAMERQLRESQRLEAIGTLAGGIALDFNNLIAAILGNVDLARQDAGAQSPAQVSLTEIRKAGLRARVLADQILSFARHQPKERKPLVLAGVVEQAVLALRTDLPPGLHMTCQCDAETPQVLANAELMRQVVVNLVTNAFQALGQTAGNIDIRLVALHLDKTLTDSHSALRDMQLRHAGPVVCLSVSDNGPGMDEKTLSRVFEPFFTLRPMGTGSGLGLAVVHGIVYAHEGVIIAHSHLGQGASFAIYLPACGEGDVAG